MKNWTSKGSFFLLIFLPANFYLFFLKIIHFPGPNEQKNPKKFKILNF